MAHQESVSGDGRRGATSATVIVLGALVTLGALLADLRPSAYASSFGLGQAVLLMLGTTVLLFGLDRWRGDSEGWRTSLASLAGADAARLVAILAQLAMVVFVVSWFQLENPAFAKQVVPFTAAAFFIHHLAAPERRLELFVVASLTAFVMVLGFVNAAWLAGVILVFISLSHVRASWNARLGLLVLAALALAVLRLFPDWTPFSRAIWPVLGSILMFRLIVYWYDVRHSKTPIPAKWSLAYFFLMPNVVFPLFPVVDFATLRRTYYDQDPFRIYQRGVEWIARGLLHLLLYRLVYQYLTLPAEEVVDGVQLVRYMVATFLLYLRVSGTFHVIVGSLHLFGFRLPETHRFFYLSTSFTDFWRRINIYWKDFMMKLVFLPVYFPLRKRGETYALVVGTLAVFFVTWLTHAYQWFWILGTGLWSATDALFWAVLGVILVANSVWESKRGRKRVLPGAARRRWPDALQNGIKAAGVFAVICTLWTMWGSPTVGDWLDLMSVPEFGLRGWAAVVGVLGTVAVAGFFAELTGRSAGDQDAGADAKAATFGAQALRSGALLAVLSLLAMPAATSPFGERAQAVARELRFPELNKRDAQALQRGYYENLQGVSAQNSQLWELYAERPTEGQDIWRSGVLVERPDFLAREMKPMFGVYQRGQSFRTNRWGMRDRDYDLAKPAGTFRIAVLGQSYVAGDGVSDGETFEEVAEDRLAALRPAGAPRIEILNFGVGSFTAAQQLLQLESRVFDFSPDVIVRVAHPSDAERLAAHTVQQLLRGVAPPWPFLDSILVEAGVDSTVRETEAAARLIPFRERMLAGIEERIVMAARARSVRAVWIYLDLPERIREPDHIASMVAGASAAGFVTLNWSDVYAGHDLGTLRSSRWDFHPNVAGHQVIADRFLREMLTLPSFGIPQAYLENR